MRNTPHTQICSAFVTADDPAAVGLDLLDEIVSLGPRLGLFIHLTTVTARCLAPSLGSGMLSSAELPWFSVVIQKYAHQLEKLPPEDRAEAEEADVKLICLSLSQQPLPTHLPILTLRLKGEAGALPSKPEHAGAGSSLVPEPQVVPGEALNLPSQTQSSL